VEEHTPAFHICGDNHGKEDERYGHGIKTNIPRTKEGGPATKASETTASETTAPQHTNFINCALCVNRDFKKVVVRGGVVMDLVLEEDEVRAETAAKIPNRDSEAATAERARRAVHRWLDTWVGGGDASGESNGNIDESRAAIPGKAETWLYSDEKLTPEMRRNWRKEYIRMCAILGLVI
jgi:hypothetical protein